MEHTNTEYESLTFREHVRLRSSTYVGSSKPTETNQWVVKIVDNNATLSKESLTYPIALYNICDEIILNAIDHCLRTKKLKGKGKCDTIKLSLDKQTGSVTVFNNGEGIIVEKIKSADGSDVYVVEMIFTKEMCGSNFSNDDEEKIGANGIGSKATNILSEIFEVSTYDAKNNLHYYQKYTGGNDIIHSPEIKKGKKSDHPFTRVSFTPDYDYFKYKKNSKEFLELMETMEYLLMTRMYYVSTYLGSSYKIFYNETSIEVKSLENLALMAVSKESLVKCNMKKDSDSAPMEVIIALWDCEQNTEHISFINGLYLSEGGTHIRYIIKHIMEAVKPKLEKKLKDKIKITNKLISNFMFIFFKGEMNNLEYKNQSKNELSISETRFKNYTMDKKSITGIWNLLESKIDELYMNKITKEVVNKKVSNLTGINKYSPADYAGTSKSSQCTLFIPEGDSAESCVRNGLSGNKDLGFKFNGLFNIQGVPMNARKEVEIKEVVRKVDGETIKDKIIDRKKKLNENERLSSLIKVLNLNWHYKYSNDEEGDKEFNTLRYGKVVIAVDADTDGIGNICSLILNFFNLFYPELIKRKYISILNTPLVRAYPIKKTYNGKKLFIEEFYSAGDFNEWAAMNDTALYKISYIKGLATHSNAEIKHMFKDMYSKISNFLYDEKDDEMFEIYFGNDSNKRKKILSENMSIENKQLCKSEGLTCSLQLNTNTRMYQLENVQRKMPHVIDGLNPARRKVLCGSIYKFRTNNNKIKVFQLGGYIAEKMLYHHGSDSLNNTIITMAQCFTGSRNIPVLLPIGQFGTHYKGGKDSGSPRYIDTKLNKEVVELLYPFKDMDLLEWTDIDGEVGEPKYFIPILPTSILEDVLLPSTGWKIELWARDFETVFRNVINMIDETGVIDKMIYFKNKFKGEEYYSGNNYMESILLGTYSIKSDRNNDYITVTSLPPRIWIDNYIDSIKDMEGVVRIRNNSCINNVDIEIKLAKGVLEKLKKDFQSLTLAKTLSVYTNSEGTPVVNYIHVYFKLYVKMNHCINMYSEDDTVLEYDNYDEILYRWFKARRDCYIKRVNREIIILRYKIIMCENYIRFIENHDSYGLSKISENDANILLRKEKYDIINKDIVECAGKIKNEDLEHAITNPNGGASYNYLMNLSYRQMNKDCHTKLLKKLKLLKEELNILQKHDSYKNIWKSELNKLRPLLLKGFTDGFYKEDETLFK